MENFNLMPFKETARKIKQYLTPQAWELSEWSLI